MTGWLLDENGDLLVDEKGNPVLGETSQQNKSLLLMTAKGSWKENPLVGIDAAYWLESEDISGLINEIRSQYTADGMKVDGITYKDGKLNIDANYTA